MKVAIAVQLEMVCYSLLVSTESGAAKMVLVMAEDATAAQMKAMLNWSSTAGGKESQHALRRISRILRLHAA